MTGFAGRPPAILSLFLFLVGAAGLGTAIALVQLHFRQVGPVSIAIEQDTPGQEAAAGIAPAPGLPEEHPAATEAAPEGPPSAEEADTDTGTGEERTSPATGPWRLPLDFDTYDPDDAGKAAIEAVAALLAADPEAKVRVIGVCGARLSKARAWQATRVVRKRLVAAGARRDCCETMVEQTRDIEGVEARIELIGEGS